MTTLSAAVWAESLKVRKSRMLWLSILAAIFMALMIGFIMFIAANPSIAAKMGLLGTKSSIFQNVNWPSYMGLLGEMISALGLLGFGFVASWIFGREYADRTVKDLLALPLPRSDIVVAKLIVAALWSVLLSLVLLIGTLAVGALIGLSGGSAEIIEHGVYVYGVTALLTILISTPVAFFASYGRGYLPPMGFVILTLILGQFMVALGIGQYFPWAIPGLFSVGGEPVAVAGYVLLLFTSLAGLALTFAWWRYADQ